MSATSKRRVKDGITGYEMPYSSKIKGKNINKNEVYSPKGAVLNYSSRNNSSKKQTKDNLVTIKQSPLSSSSSEYGRSYKPNTPKQIKTNTVEDNHEENNYDDDEDDYSYDYDEDFEDDFESETEGSTTETFNEEDDHYDNSTTSYNNSSSYKDKRLNFEMQQVKQSIIEENSSKWSSNKGGGDEDVRRNKNASAEALNRSFINFSSAKKRQSNKILAGKTRQRGDELLTMIRLGR